MSLTTDPNESRNADQNVDQLVVELTLSGGFETCDFVALDGKIGRAGVSFMETTLVPAKGILTINQ